MTLGTSPAIIATVPNDPDTAITWLLGSIIFCNRSSAARTVRLARFHPSEGETEILADGAAIAPFDSYTFRPGLILRASESLKGSASHPDSVDVHVSVAEIVEPG